MEVLEQVNAKAICTNAQRIQPKSLDTPNVFFPEAVSRFVTLDELLGTNSVICSSTLIHRSLLAIAGPFPESPSLKAIEDYALWLRIASLAPFHFLAEPLVRYHDNPKESVRQEDVEPLEQRLRVLQDVTPMGHPAQEAGTLSGPHKNKTGIEQSARLTGPGCLAYYQNICTIPTKPLMKILHTVESYLPARHGMSEVVRQLSEGFVRRGHEVTVATSENGERDYTTLEGVKIRSFPISGNAIRGTTGPTDEYMRFVKEGGFDLITCFAAQQWATDLLLPHLSSISAKKVFVPTGFSALHDPNYTDYFTQMPDWLRSFDANVFLSDTYQDAAFAQRQGITNSILIPNGASYEEFADKPTPYLRKKLGISRRSTLILHVGSYTGEKGHREAIEIFLKARIRNATLLFVGQNPAKVLKIFGRKIRYIELPKSYLLAGKRAYGAYPQPGRYRAGLPGSRCISISFPHRMLTHCSLRSRRIGYSFSLFGRRQCPRNSRVDGWGYHYPHHSARSEGVP